MGAGASVNAVFEEATTWFRNYFDESTYIEDFQSIDKNKDGSVTFAELKMWIAGKAKKEGGNWKQLLDKPEIYKIAHIQTSQRFAERANDEVRTQIFGITEFRTFLIYIFIISILSVHFHSADSWEDGGDAGNDTLSLDEFRLASRSFCNTRKQERLKDDVLQKDFEALDSNGDGMVSFVEICNYFCTNFEKDILSSNGSTKGGGGSVRLSSHFGETSGQHVKEQVGAATKTSEALNAIHSELDKSRKIANLTEIKLSTELAIGHSTLISPEAQQKMIMNIETEMMVRQGSGVDKPFNPDSRQGSGTGNALGARDSPIGALVGIGEHHAAEDADTSISLHPAANRSNKDREKAATDAVSAAQGEEKKEQQTEAVIETADATAVVVSAVPALPIEQKAATAVDSDSSAVDNSVFESPRAAATAAAAATDVATAQ